MKNGLPDLATGRVVLKKGTSGVKTGKVQLFGTQHRWLENGTWIVKNGNTGG
jgi:hypothetical protein